MHLLQCYFLVWEGLHGLGWGTGYPYGWICTKDEVQDLEGVAGLTLEELSSSLLKFHV